MKIRRFVVTVACFDATPVETRDVIVAIDKSTRIVESTGGVFSVTHIDDKTIDYPEPDQTSDAALDAWIDRANEEMP